MTLGPSQLYLRRSAVAGDEPSARTKARALRTVLHAVTQLEVQAPMACGVQPFPMATLIVPEGDPALRTSFPCLVAYVMEWSVVGFGTM